MKDVALILSLKFVIYLPMYLYALEFDIAGLGEGEKGVK